MRKVVEMMDVFKEEVVIDQKKIVGAIRQATVEMKESIKTDIKTELIELKIGLSEISQHNTDVRNYLLALKEEFKQYREKAEAEICDLKETVGRLETKLKEQEEENEIENRQRRKLNIIVREKAEEASDCVDMRQHMSEIFATIANEAIQVQCVQVLTAKNNDGMRTSRIKLSSFEDKMKIMQNKKDSLKGKKIFIDDDLTKKEVQMQKGIRLVAEQEKEKGHNVKIGYGKLIINGECVKWTELEKEKQPVRRIAGKSETTGLHGLLPR